MLDKIKQIDKKFLMIGGVLIGAIVLVIILMVVIKLLAGPGKNYSKLEEKLQKAAQDYLKDNPESIPEEGSSIVLDAETIISAGNMSSMDKYVDDTCTGYVTIMNNSGLSLYLPHIECTEYHTVHLSDKIIEDQLVEDPDNPYQGGLYQVGDEYIFKGKSVNNYISFGGLLWRVLRVDENGNLRVVKAEAESRKRIWDNKYNVDIKRSYGINDYQNSYLKEVLDANYKEIKDKNKAHLIPHDVCIGKRSKNDLSLSYDIDCSEVLPGQYLSVVNTLDFPMASLDENCTYVGSGACTNYNYLYSTVTSSWTSIGSADISYEAFYIGGGYINTQRTNKNSAFHWLIYLSGQELYTSGSGTKDDPYVIQ